MPGVYLSQIPKRIGVKSMEKREGKNNMKFSDVIAKNKEKFLRIAEENTTRNSDGHTVIKLNDPCREDEHPRRKVIERKVLVEA